MKNLYQDTACTLYNYLKCLGKKFYILDESENHELIFKKTSEVSIYTGSYIELSLSFWAARTKKISCWENSIDF